jgi:hypothetical protein
VEVCASDRRWRLEERCEAANLCNDVSGSCGRCSDNDALQCNLTRLEQCSDEGTWMLLDDCDNDAQCNAALGAARADPEAFSGGC